MKVIVPPKFSKLVCNYTLAAKIKDLGVMHQCKALLYYHKEDDVANGEHISCNMLMNPTNEHVAAFNATELTYMIGHKFRKPDLIPSDLFTKHDREGEFGHYTLNGSRKFKTQPDALATLLIEYLSNDQLRLERVNERIQTLF